MIELLAPQATRLGRRQRELLEAIRRFTRDNGYSPTIRELALAVGLRSNSSVAHLLETLEAAGAVTWVRGKVRTLKVLW